MALASCAGPEEPCFFDARCLGETEDPYGGLGCNAGGHSGCRFCGFGDYVEVECPAPPGVEEGGVQVVLTLAGDIDESWFNPDKPGPLNRFKALLRSDLAVLLGISFERLLVLDVRAGSIVVELVIMPPADGTVNATSVTDALGALRAALSAHPPPMLVGMTVTALDVVQLEEAQSPSSPPFVTISALTSAGSGGSSMSVGAVGAAAVMMVLVAWAIHRHRRRRRLAGDKSRDSTPEGRRLSAVERGPVSLADINSSSLKLQGTGHARSNNASPTGLRKQRSHKGDDFDDFDAFGDVGHKPTRTHRRGRQDGDMPSYLPSAARLPAPEKKLLVDLGGGGRTPRIHTDDEESAPAMSRTTRLGPSGREAIGLGSQQGTRRGHIERPESMRATPSGRTARALPLPSAAQLPAPDRRAIPLPSAAQLPAPDQSALPLPSAAQLPAPNFAQGKAAQRMKSCRNLNDLTSQQVTSRNLLTQRQSSIGNLNARRTTDVSAAARAAKRARALEVLTTKQKELQAQRAVVTLFSQKFADGAGSNGDPLSRASVEQRQHRYAEQRHRVRRVQNADVARVHGRVQGDAAAAHVPALPARRSSQAAVAPVGSAPNTMGRAHFAGKVPSLGCGVKTAAGSPPSQASSGAGGSKQSVEFGESFRAMFQETTVPGNQRPLHLPVPSSGKPAPGPTPMRPKSTYQQRLSTRNLVQCSTGAGTLADMLAVVREEKVASLPVPPAPLGEGHALPVPLAHLESALPVPQSSQPATAPAASSAAAAPSFVGHSHFAGKVPTLAGRVKTATVPPPTQLPGTFRQRLSNRNLVPGSTGGAKFADMLAAVREEKAAVPVLSKRVMPRGTTSVDSMDGFEGDSRFSAVGDAAPPKPVTAGHEDRFSKTSELPGQRMSMDQVQDPLSSDRPLSSERPLSLSSDGTRTDSSDVDSSDNPMADTLDSVALNMAHEHDRRVATLAFAVDEHAELDYDDQIFMPLSIPRTPRAPVAPAPVAPPVLADSPRTPRLTPRSEHTRVKI